MAVDYFGPGGVVELSPSVLPRTAKCLRSAVAHRLFKLLEWKRVERDELVERDQPLVAHCLLGTARHPRARSDFLVVVRDERDLTIRERGSARADVREAASFLGETFVLIGVAEVHVDAHAEPHPARATGRRTPLRTSSRDGPRRIAQ